MGGGRRSQARAQSESSASVGRLAKVMLEQDTGSALKDRSPDDDPMDDRLERRIFLQRLAFLGGGFVLIGGSCKSPARHTAPAPVRPAWLGKVPTTSHVTFTDDEYRNVEAICERILPKDQDPGADEAGVPVYIDRMLASPELSEMRDVFQGGLMAIERRAQVSFHKSYAALGGAEQDLLLAEFRDAPEGSGKSRFFETLLVLTLEGFLGDPSYGGNRDRVGWALVGFDTSMPAHYRPNEPGMRGMGR